MIIQRVIICFFVILMNIDINHAQEKEKIMGVLMDQCTAWNDGNVALYMEGYYKSDSLEFAGGRNITYGWNEVLNRYKISYPDKSSMGYLTFSGIRIKLLSQEYAYVTGRWEITRQEKPVWGVFTLLFQLIGEKWKIISDHSS